MKNYRNYNIMPGPEATQVCARTPVSDLPIDY